MVTVLLVPDPLLSTRDSNYKFESYCLFKSTNHSCQDLRAERALLLVICPRVSMTIRDKGVRKQEGRIDTTAAAAVNVIYMELQLILKLVRGDNT